MKFVQLILRKIIKIVATRCQILRLKYTKFDFGAGGAYSAPQRGLLLRQGRGGKRGGAERGGDGGEGRGGKTGEEEREGRGGRRREG